MGEGKSNICLDCDKSCGLCSWSSSLTPVPGWTAKPIKKRINDGVIVNSWHITACPQFEGTPYVNGNPWSPAEIELLCDLMKAKTPAKTMAKILNRDFNSVRNKIQSIRKKQK